MIAAFVASTAIAVFATSGAAEPERKSKPFYVKRDREVTKSEPPPHHGVGQSTAYRYFDDVTDAKVIFRKRALHKGAAIGLHVLTHDEVYYVLSGKGEVTVDGKVRAVEANTAIYMYEGQDVGIKQLGAEDLVLIISYPPALQK
jgi:mannose-6-phosphate isomerase-like protein (cupin superfamily)